MSKKKIQIGIAAALGGMAVSPAGSEVSAKNPVKTETATSLDSLELEQKLIEIAGEDEKIPPPLAVAMCYEISVMPPVDYLCPGCGETTSGIYDRYIISNLDRIEEVVTSIQKMGYDAVLDRSGYCPHCRTGEEASPELIFRIRFSDAADYHIAKSNVYTHYEILRRFLSDKEDLTNFYEKNLTVSEHIEIIQKMTGLGKDADVK